METTEREFLNYTKLPIKTKLKNGMGSVDTTAIISRRDIEDGFIILEAQTEEEEETMQETFSNCVMMLNGASLKVQMTYSELLEKLERENLI